MTNQTQPLARNSDPRGSHQAAAKAKKSLGNHKFLALRAVKALGQATPQEAAHHALSEGWVQLRSMESIRRRVPDLETDGLLQKVGFLREDAEVYELTGQGRMDFARELSRRS